jgi:LPS-assembly protein
VKKTLNKYFIVPVFFAVTTFAWAGSPDSNRQKQIEQESNWPLCTDSLDIPARPVVESEIDPGDVHVAADNADLESEGISTLDGNVEITRDDQQIRADTVQFDQIDNTADLEGNIQYWDKSIYLEADKAHIEFNTDNGQFENTKYTIKDNRGRGQSANLDMIIGTETNLKQADYSTCDPENKFWALSAGEIHLDHVEEWGSARNVVLKIKDIPVFYSPYMSFPLSDKRKTGFLTPGMGSSNRNGVEARTPFYWNIAPQMDATLTPRLLTDSGLMLIGEFRHMSKYSESELNAEYLPSDNNFNDKDRNLLGISHKNRFADTGNFSLNYNRVSDKEYFEDFGSSLGITSKRFLQQRGEISYTGNWWNASAKLENYQSVDRTIAAVDRPYKRLPQINFNAHSPGGNNKLRYMFRSDFTYFDRDDGITGLVDNVTGSRLNLVPSISYPYRTASTFVTPRLDMRYTQYDLSNTSTFKSSPSRLLPVVSVDSGVLLERDFSIFGKKTIQTLEPRIFYLYVPDKDQDDLPVFDTGLYDFSFNSLFREDRFSGSDRLGDANQFTFALTSRLIDHDTGRERSYLSLGQIYYLNDRNVTLPGDKKRDDNSSPIVAEIGTTLFNHWRIRGDLQWDPNTKTTEKLLAQIQYNPAKNKVVNFNYRVRKTSPNLSGRSLNLTDIEQSDISFHWPLNQNWSMIGRWNYAIPENRSLETFGGIEYDSCCWGFRAVARRFLTDINGNFDTGIFFQLELKGLSGVGRKTVDFLKQKIPGYESEL